MPVKVRLAGVLRHLAGTDTVSVEATTVRELVEGLRTVNERLYERVWDCSEKDLAPDIYIAVNDVDIRLLDGLNTRVGDGDTVLLLSYIHGG